jgi:general secretion pathway protein D
MVLSITTAAWSQDATADQAKASFQKGETAYNSMDFKDAKVCFLEANKNAKSLSDADQKKLADYLGKIDPQIKKQQGGYEAFNGASAAMAAGDLAKAKDGFTQAADNDSLPPATRKDARAQLALVNDKMRVAAAPLARPAQSLKVTATTGPAVTMPPANTTTAPCPTPAPKTGPAPVTPAPAANPAKVQADQAKALVDTGNQKLAANKPDEAVKDFSRAAQLDPANADAKAGLDKARNMVAANDNTPIGALERNRRIALQAAEIEFDADMKRSDDALRGADSKGAFDAAADALHAADNVLENNRNFYPADEFRQKKDQVQRQDALIKERQEAWDRVQVAKQQEDVRKAELDRKRHAEVDRRKRISDLTERAQALRTEQKFAEAVEVYNQILKLDPTNTCAADMKAALEQFVLLRVERTAVANERIEEHKALNDVRESEIPWYELLLYPRDWREITARRQPFGADQAGGESDADRAVRQKLNQKIQKLDFSDTEFANVIEFLRDISGVNIVPKWQLLSAAGIDKTAAVNVHLTDVRLDKALKVILEDVGGANPLGYIIDDGVVTISTKDDLSKKMITNVYDIRDLIISIPNFVGPRIDLSAASSSTGGQNGGSGGGQSVFGSGQQTSTEQIKTKADIVKDILTLISTTIDKDSWGPLATGGGGSGLGSITEMNGQLVVTQTTENHSALLSLINKLREARALQIAIEARFVSVDTSFLQTIGVNLDAYFNLGSRLGSTTNVDPWTGAIVPATGGQSGWGPSQPGTNNLTPVPVTSNNTGINFVTPNSLETGKGLNIGNSFTTPSLTTSFTFLDDIQLNFLLQATQANASTRSLTAPRLTLFNGQRAYVSIATQQAYVSALTPVVADNVVAYQPTVSYVPTGSVLDVEATISADRRYVTLTIRPQVCTLVKFDDYVIAGTTTGDSGVGHISLPTVVIQDLETTVSVPDGGTLLLGGQKLSSETEHEVGVPILSKIPVIDRLFTSRGNVRDEETLLILVKPKIIIQKEEEDRQDARNFQYP